MTKAVRLREGIVERLRESRGIASEDAFARLVGSDRRTLRRVKAGAQPGGTFMANFCEAFGMSLGEVFEVVTVNPLALQELDEDDDEIDGVAA